MGLTLPIGEFQIDSTVYSMFERSVLYQKDVWKPLTTKKSSQLQVPKARNVTTRLLLLSKSLHFQQYAEQGAIELTFSRTTSNKGRKAGMPMFEGVTKLRTQPCRGSNLPR